MPDDPRLPVILALAVLAALLVTAFTRRRLRERRALAARAATVREAVATGRISIPHRPWRLVVIGLLGAALVAGFLRIGAAGWTEGLVVLLLIGLPTAVVLAQQLPRALAALLGNGPQLRMDRDGIEDPAIGRIPWSEIEAVTFEEVQPTLRLWRGLRVLEFRVRRPDRYLDAQPWLVRWARRGWRRTPPATGTLRVDVTDCDAPMEVIRDAAVSLRRGAARD